MSAKFTLARVFSRSGLPSPLRAGGVRLTRFFRGLPPFPPPLRGAGGASGGTAPALATPLEYRVKLAALSFVSRREKVSPPPPPPVGRVVDEKKGKKF